LQAAETANLIYQNAYQRRNLITYLLLRGHLCAKMDVCCRGCDSLRSPAACPPLRSRLTEAGACTHACHSATAEVMRSAGHRTSAASAHSWDEWCMAASRSSSKPGTSPGHAAGSRSAMAGSQPAVAGSGASQPSMAGNGAVGARGKVVRSASMREGARRLGSADRGCSSTLRGAAPPPPWDRGFTGPTSATIVRPFPMVRLG